MTHAIDLSMMQAGGAIPLSVASPPPVPLTFGEVQRQTENDYNLLINRPFLDSRLIEGDISEQDPTVSRWAKQPTAPLFPDNVSGIPMEELRELWDGV